MWAYIQISSVIFPFRRLLTPPDRPELHISTRQQQQQALTPCPPVTLIWIQWTEQERRRSGVNLLILQCEEELLTVTGALLRARLIMRLTVVAPRWGTACCTKGRQASLNSTTGRLRWRTHSAPAPTRLLKIHFYLLQTRDHGLSCKYNLKRAYSINRASLFINEVENDCYV